MLNTDIRIALLIDGDNAQATLIPSILELLSKKYGTCVIRRVYGDWTASKMSGWHKLEQAHAIQLVQQSSYVKGKNATDIALTVAAMEILHSGKVDAFCIVSSDSDFTPLVVRLKDEGVTVIGVGKSTTPESFRTACTRFIDTDTLPNSQKPPAKASPPKTVVTKKDNSKSSQPSPAQTNLKKDSSKTSPDARELLKKAYEKTPNKDGWVFLGALGQSLRQDNPQFNPKSYGQKGLAQLVSQHSSLFEIRQEKGKGMYIKRRP